MNPVQHYSRTMKRILTALIIAFSTLTAGAQSLSTLYKAALALQGAYKVYQAYTITDEQLAQYMRGTMEEMDATNKVCAESSAYTQRLKRLTRGMTNADGIRLNFKVYEGSQTANAFASPDGSVRVYSRLMDVMSDDELLGILGHEMGHLAHRDSKKAYRTALVASAVRDGLMMDDGTVGQLAASALGDVGEAMLTTKYSRDQERGADDYGYEYLKSHNVNPWAMAKAFEKLKALQNDRSGKYARAITTLLSTHPDLDERIERMSKRAKSDGYKR